MIAGWALLGPVVARHHAVAVRREYEASCPELAWYFWAPDVRAKDNWVAREIASVAGPLVDDLARRAVVGTHARPAVPAAEGLDELSMWIEDELSSPSGVVSAPPDAATRLMSRRAPELDAVRAILLAGDVSRFTSSDTWAHQDCVHRLLLGHALSSIRSGDVDEADRDLLAAWRLARSLNRPASRWSRSVEMSRDLAVALRKMPRIGPEWDHRLDVEPVRDAAARRVVMDAARWLHGAENIHQYYGEVGAEPPVLGFYYEPIESWQLTSQARWSIMHAQAMRDPSRLASEQLDTLAAHFELTRKVAHLQRLRSTPPSDEWPEFVPGLELSDCAGLSWTYSGGERAILEPFGPFAAWVAPAECAPALGYVSAR